MENKNFYTLLILVIILVSHITTIIPENILKTDGTIDQNKIYDVVIVGAGLSGLSCAYHLQNHDLLILEKENRLGGRVLTHSKFGISYDLGAIFCYDVPEKARKHIFTYLPFETTSPSIIEEKGRMGLYYDNKMCYSEYDNETSPYKNAVLNCLKTLATPEDFNQILDYAANNRPLNRLSPVSYKIINALFRIAYPGELKQYAPQVHQYAFKYWPSLHYEKGNYEVIKAFCQNIKSPIYLNSEVIEVKPTEDKVNITFIQAGEQKIISAKCAVVTTPATITKTIVKSLPEECLDFLNTVKYGKNIVMALGINKKLPNFLGCITVDPHITVYQRETTEPDKTLLLVLYYDKEATALAHLSDEALVEVTLPPLRELQLDIEKKDIIYSDIQRWEHGGIILTKNLLKSRPRNFINPIDRIFLAGEYLGPTYQGMPPAIISGKNTAEKVESFLTQN